MKKKRTEYESKDENAFALSTGDLMASLLFIFILLLMGALLQVQEKAEQDEEIVKRYDQIKTQLTSICSRSSKMILQFGGLQ